MPETRTRQLRTTRRRPSARPAEYLQAIADIAQVTLDGADSDAVFGLIVHKARLLVGGAFSTIGSLSEGEPVLLTLRAAEGERAALLQVGSAVPIAHTLAADVVRTGQALVLDGPDAAPEPFGSILRRFDLGPALCVPLMASGRIFGAMSISDFPGSAPFHAANVALVEAFAGQAAITLEFARVREDLRRLAVLDERERIARELHDGAIQGLFGLGLDLHGLGSELEASPIAARLDVTVGRLDEVIRELRSYIAELRPGLLNTASAPPARPRAPQEPSGAARVASSGFEHRLRTIGTINQAILDRVDVQTMFERLVHSARSLVDADSAAVGTLEGAGDLVVRAGEGSSGAVLGEAVRAGRARVVADGPAGASIAVPLVSRGQVFGALAVGRTSGRGPFAARDVRLVAIFGAQAAIGLEYRRALDELNRLAVLRERERIARELHEGVIQTLFGVGMDVQALASATDVALTSRRLDRAVEGIDSVIRDLRNYVFGQRPGILADRQLDRALRDLATDFSQRAGIVPRLDIDPDTAARLGGATAIAVVQIAREALSNVARHAAAGKCGLALRTDDGAAILEVSDDGRGLGELKTGSGDGLPNMRARAAGLGGVLSVGPGADGRGTLVRLRVPL
jgi:signal transduction histidine kinase